MRIQAKRGKILLLLCVYFMSSADLSLRAIDFDQWPRKQHFELFQNFTQPYFNVCVKLSAKKLYTACKQTNRAFFHGYVYCLLKACHEYEPMMLRIVNQKPYYLKYLPYTWSIIEKRMKNPIFNKLSILFKKYLPLKKLKKLQKI